jgi:sigma-B regulation protein RsbU (phosphoserine phosphatase)
MLKIHSKALSRFVQQQITYIFIAVVITAMFWSIGQPVNIHQFFTFVLYSICFSNLVSRPAERLSFLYAERHFPYNWLAFLVVLILVGLPAYLITGVLVWWIAPPFPISFVDWITKGWKFPLLILVVFGVVRYLYETTKDRLERRNVKLQQLVEVGATRLEMQERELERAREIQQSLLPKDIPQLMGFEVAGTWQPARTVGGDYFDVLRLSKNRLGICIADVVGKGISAALLMANVQATVRAFAQDAKSPAGVCRRVNQILCDNLAPGKFVTFFYGILDGETGTFQYCNAGHPYPILVSPGSTRALDRGGAVLGVFPAWNYEDAVVDLSPGDRLLLFTDGITEAARLNGQEFGTGNVAAFGQAHRTSSASELMNQLFKQVTDFCGAQFQDDATLVTIAVNQFPAETNSRLAGGP